MTENVVVDNSYEAIITVSLDFNQWVGRNVANMRRSKKMTQQQLSEKLFISRSAVSNMEQGIHLLSINNLYVMCEIFECEAKDIIKF